MKDVGVDLTTLGLFSLVGLPYSLKFFWAPALDTFSIPYLTKMLGRRRSWLITSQILLIISIVYLGSLNPLVHPWLIACAALAVATLSATQDIVIDAYRIERLDANEQAAGTAYYVSAYRVALLLSSAGTIFFVWFLEQQGVAQSQVWFYGYTAAALCMGVGLIATLISQDPKQIPNNSIDLTSQNNTNYKSSFSRFWQTTTQAFLSFFTIPAATYALLFIIFFKFSDAIAGFMTGPFVLDIGFDKSAYASIVKGVGLLATLVGGFFGGLIAYRYSIYFNLWFAACVQMLSNLAFIWLAWVGPDHTVLVITITVENLAGGFGTIIFLAYISQLCHMPLHTATQFALLTALSSIGRTLLSASSGSLAESFGWINFFIISSIIALPALILLIIMKERSHFEYLYNEQENGQSSPVDSKDDGCP